MQNILLTAQLIISVSLVISILMQKRGAGLGGAFGGSGGSYYQRRGAEKMLYYSSIILSLLFVGIAFAILFF